MFFSVVVLLVVVNMLMLMLNQVDSKLFGKLLLVSFDVVKMMVSFMMCEGMNVLFGSIFQSVFQLGIIGVGVKLEYKGLQNERGVFKYNVVKIDKLIIESYSIKNVLNGQNSVKFGVEGVDFLKLLNMKKIGIDVMKNFNDVMFKFNVGISVMESLGIKNSNK